MKRPFDKTLQKPIKPGYHRFLLSVSPSDQAQVVGVEANTPEDAVQWGKEQGYTVKGEAQEKPLTEGTPEANALRKKNQQQKTKYKRFDITVTGAPQKTYVDARTEDEAKQWAESQGYDVIKSHGAVDKKGLANEGPAPKTPKTQKPGKPLYWGLTVRYGARRIGAQTVEQPQNSFEVIKAVSYEEAIKKLKEKATELGRTLLNVFNVKLWDQKKRQWNDTGIKVPAQMGSSTGTQKWRVTGAAKTGYQVNQFEFTAKTEQSAREKLQKAGLVKIYELEYFDPEHKQWVDVDHPQAGQPGTQQQQTAPQQPGTQQQQAPQQPGTQQQQAPAKKSWFGGWGKAASLERPMALTRDTLGPIRIYTPAFTVGA